MRPQERGQGDLARVWLIALAALAAISLPNLADPMIRHDDFPALLAQPEGFWAKTLHEGRWLNYLWHLRGLVTPSWLNFALYQALWALVAACAAVQVAGRGAPLPAAALTALLILVAPPATLISLWFNTLIPGLALVALYAWLGTWARPRAMLALMPVFVVLSFMAYTTYPLLVLTLCLISRRARGPRDLAVVLALFAASFAGAVLAVYTLNLAVHGVFGVPLADWRQASPASDLAGLRANLPLLGTSLAGLAEKASFGFAPMVWLHIGLFAASAAVLLRRVPGEAVYLLAGLAVGLALVAVQVLKMGALVPPRGFLFVWLIHALMAGRAVQLLAAGAALRLLRGAVLLVVGSYGLQTFVQYTTYRGWQAETRALVAQAAGADRVEVSGDVLALRSARAAFVQTPAALGYRFAQLGGGAVVLCTPERAANACTGDGLRVEIGGGTARLAASDPL